MYDQLVQLLLLIGVADEVQKKLLVSVLHDIMSLDNINDKFPDAATPLMKVLATNAFKTPNELLAFTKELTQELYNKLADESEEPVVSPEPPMKIPAPVCPKQQMAVDLKYAKVSVEIECLREEIDKLINVQDFIKAEELKQQRIVLEKEKEAIATERFNLFHPADDSASESETGTQAIQQKDSQPLNLSDYPDELFKCLQIFTACLEFGAFTEVDGFILSHIDKFVSLLFNGFA